MSYQAELNALAAHIGTTIANLPGGGGGFRVVAVNVLTASGTLGLTGSPTVTLNAKTTHLTGHLFGGGASGANGASSPIYVEGYDEYGYPYYNYQYSAVPPGGGGGQILPLPLIRKADLTFPLSYTIGLGGAKPVAPTAVTSSVTAISAINAGSDTLFGPWSAAGAPATTIGGYSNAPGWMTTVGLNNALNALAVMATGSMAASYGHGRFGGGTNIGGALPAPPWVRDVTAPGGGSGGYWDGSTSRGASLGGAVGNLLAATPPALSLTTAPAATSASPSGVPFSGIAGPGGSGGTLHRPGSAISAVGGDGADGGFPSGGGGGGGHAAAWTVGQSAKGGRGGKGGDGCIVLLELEQQ